LAGPGRAWRAQTLHVRADAPRQQAGGLGVLEGNPVLLLFVVVAAGAAFGRVKFRGFSLGPAAALFCGLATSALDPKLQLPEVVQTFGLVVFAYTTGVASGPSFVGGLRRRGLSAAAAVVVTVGVAAIAAAVVAPLVGVHRAGVGGLFAGAVTNTPALATVVGKPGTNPVVAYSLAYPAGVLGMLLAAHLVLRAKHGTAASDAEPLVSWTVEVTRPGLPPLGELQSEHRLAFGRAATATDLAVATPETRLRPGDRVTVVGTRNRVKQFTEVAGHRSAAHLALDRGTLDFRRIVLSSRKLAGRTLGELELTARFGAIPTRVRRGDVDLVARDDLVVEVGDRIRVVAPLERMSDVATYLGDSERGLGEIDAVSLALGIVAGLLVGLVKLPLPGGSSFSLGSAGGPLVAGLVLGAIGRVGPVSFRLYHQESTTLRQIGTLLFLAAVGTRSGSAFAHAVSSWHGVGIVAAGVVVTTVTVVVASCAARRVLGLDPVTASGMLAGMQTQPAVLAFASERTANDDRVNVGYALVYPVAMLVKLLLAQLLAS
jgi:putative transport protein